LDARRLSYSNPFDSTGFDKLSDILGSVKAYMRNTPLGQGLNKFNNFTARTIGAETPEELESQKLLQFALENMNPAVIASLKDISPIVKPASAELLRRIAKIKSEIPNAKPSLVKASVPPQMFNKYQGELKDILGGGTIKDEAIANAMGKVDDRYNISTNKFPEEFEELQQTLNAGSDQDVILLNANKKINEPDVFYSDPKTGETNMYGALDDLNSGMHPQVKGVGDVEDMISDIEYRLGELDGKDYADELGKLIERYAPQLTNKYLSATRSKDYESTMDKLSQLEDSLYESLYNGDVSIGGAGKYNLGWMRGDQLDDYRYKLTDPNILQDPNRKFKDSYLIDEIQSDLDTWKRPKRRDSLQTYSPQEILNWAEKDPTLGPRSFSYLMEKSKGYNDALDFVNRIGNNVKPNPNEYNPRMDYWKYIVDTFVDKHDVPYGPDLKSSLGPVGYAYSNWADTLMTNVIQQAVKDQAPGIFLHSPESIKLKGDAAGMIDSVNEKYYDKLPKRFGFELTQDHPFAFNKSISSRDPNFDINNLPSGKVPMWYLDLSDILR